MVLLGLGSTAVATLGHYEHSVGYENSALAGFCDLMDRIFRHGLDSNVRNGFSMRFMSEGDQSNLVFVDTVL